MTNSTPQKLGAEFIGTALLVFVGAGCFAATQKIGAPFSMAELAGISFAFMLIVVAMVYAIGHISGCQINPAVTVALAATGKIPWRVVPGYVLAQCAGAFAGALAIAGVLGKEAATKFNVGAVDYGTISFGRATFAELLGTAILVFTVFGCIDGRSVPGWAGFAIGGVVFAIIVVVGPATGAAINPARYLGTVFGAGALGGTMHLGHLPAYLIGEFLGGIVGAVAYVAIGRTRETAVPTPSLKLEEVPA
ncbi:MAG: glycerol uptake facilitator protein [Frankiaceae bacterium]|jgi:glycerol uptake facilitator protein|nr:glycerol uptake facilitator protein [Frankiaceae bacterium]